MEIWTDWRKRAKEWKKDNKQTDAYLASNMPARGKSEEPPSRAQIQAWLGGRYSPTLKDFMDLCAAMGADPGLILFGKAVMPGAVKHDSKAKIAMTSSPTATPGHAELVKSLEKARTFKKNKTRLRRVVIKA